MSEQLNEKTHKGKNAKRIITVQLPERLIKAIDKQKPEFTSRNAAIAQALAEKFQPTAKTIAASAQA